ncbi:MAG: peptidylprolyl isomerase [Xanthomonadales bacterium]|jgi:peptidyl-prolyl cis-trans isomerase A (cyclophilin A)|nr:peptidylprolyl isomerase [Xanthomonadales bacterium]
MRLILIALALFASATLHAQAPAKEQPKPQVVLTTGKGEIVIELEPAKAPKSVENFVAYVKSGFYDGTIFHRVIGNFMIQGGGYLPSLVRKPTRAPIELEVGRGLSNTRGTIAMARTNDPNSATSQFFINVVDNPSLDTLGGGYAVFGRVVSGMEVVDAIKDVPTQAKGAEFANLPVDVIVIRKAELKGAAK